MAEAEFVQVPVTFEDVAVYFSEDEWGMLAGWQKELYKETMKENYETLTLLGCLSEKPSLISKIEREEDPCVRDQQDPRDRRKLRSSWRGYGNYHENKKHHKGSAENQETHRTLPQKDKEMFIVRSEGRRGWKRDSDTSEEREIPAEIRRKMDSNSGTFVHLGVSKCRASGLQSQCL
ncbi:zinc finger protein 707 isoform X2 [Microcaecilia unicolor]|uniref:Zinc finger protein 707-like isoform X2 n=1 Tax=Microcaecilia unicolor TaxID=1415580 RepID=A0A6P7X480_9AMPH|nr:zinc finger protein 707-like isoform X2 [Microcaecilia unicolor]